MTPATSFDIRLPIGGLFTALGLLVGGYGISTGGDAYVRSLGVNVNLWWGLVMLAFGVLLLVGASRAKGAASARPAAETIEGRAIEVREHRLGLEDESELE